jgi:hypothetical protein
MCPTQLFPMMFPPPCSPSSQCVYQNVCPSKDFYTSFGRSMTSSTHITLNPKPYLLLPWHLKH